MDGVQRGVGKATQECNYPLPSKELIGRYNLIFEERSVVSVSGNKLNAIRAARVGQSAAAEGAGGRKTVTPPLLHGDYRFGGDITIVPIISAEGNGQNISCKDQARFFAGISEGNLYLERSAYGELKEIGPTWSNPSTTILPQFVQLEIANTQKSEGDSRIYEKSSKTSSASIVQLDYYGGVALWSVFGNGKDRHRVYVASG